MKRSTCPHSNEMLCQKDVRFPNLRQTKTASYIKDLVNKFMGNENIRRATKKKLLRMFLLKYFKIFSTP